MLRCTDIGKYFLKLLLLLYNNNYIVSSSNSSIGSSSRHSSSSICNIIIIIIIVELLYFSFVTDITLFHTFANSTFNIFMVLFFFLWRSDW